MRAMRAMRATDLCRTRHTAVVSQLAVKSRCEGKALQARRASVVASGDDARRARAMRAMRATDLCRMRRRGGVAVLTDRVVDYVILQWSANWPLSFALHSTFNKQT